MPHGDQKLTHLAEKNPHGDQKLTRLDKTAFSHVLEARTHVCGACVYVYISVLDQARGAAGGHQRQCTAHDTDACRCVHVGRTSNPAALSSLSSTATGASEDEAVSPSGGRPLPFASPFTTDMLTTFVSCPKRDVALIWVCATPPPHTLAAIFWFN